MVEGVHGQVLRTRHVYSPLIAVANLKWFEGLSKADRKLIRQCMQEAVLYQIHWNRKNMADFLENLKRKGMIVDEAPDVTSFRNHVADIQNYAIFQDPGTRKLLKQFMMLLGCARTSVDNSGFG